MSHELKNNTWQPSASLQTMRARAHMVNLIRGFFAERKVLEVETPLLCHYGVTDQHIENISANYSTNKDCFLQTSPEYAMKRLLANGSGCIYQICKAFRFDESGKHHNPEFTMLEWYRIDFNHHQLMDEMDVLLQLLLNCDKATRLSYQNAFIHYANIDPLKANLYELLATLSHHEIELSNTVLNSLSKDDALQLILSHIIEPQLSQQNPIFIYDFPKSQAALAKIATHDPNVAERFEVYYKGLELANGFCELTDAAEQEQRFQADQKYRQEHGLPDREIDPYFIDALKYGLPNCSGVAMGLDRVLMLATNCKEIQEVISFDWNCI